MVEQPAHNRLVVGSIPAGPTKLDKIKNLFGQVQNSGVVCPFGSRHQMDKVRSPCRIRQGPFLIGESAHFAEAPVRVSTSRISPSGYGFPGLPSVSPPPASPVASPADWVNT